MKALSLTQPWAILVAIGAKRIETRSWRTRYRGPLAIHAAKALPASAINLCFEMPFRAALMRGGIHQIGDLPRGAIIATCVLYDCQRTDFLASEVAPDEADFGDYSFGRFGFLLRDIVRLPVPIAAKGALGLWDWLPPEEYPRCD